MTKYAPDALVLLGIGSVGYGAWLIHPSLAFVGVGASVTFIGIWLHRRKAKKTSNAEARQ